LNSISQQYVPRVEISQLNVIYNVPYPTLLLYIGDKLTRNAFLILTQEIKQDIIFQCGKPALSARHVTNPQRLATHLDSFICWFYYYFQYIGLAKYGKTTTMLQTMGDINLESP
jgi:hypothetical protein